MAREDIEALRAHIDALDGELLALLARRAALARAVGALKAEQGLPARQPAREAALLAERAARAAELGLDPVRVRAVFEAVVALCRALQSAPP